MPENTPQHHEALSAHAPQERSGVREHVLFVGSLFARTSRNGVLSVAETIVDLGVRLGQYVERRKSGQAYTEPTEYTPTLPARHNRRAR